MTTIPELYRGLCDDAAIFPPGLKPLEAAVPDHVQHVRSDYGALVGPFVIGAAKLVELPPLLQGMPQRSFDLSVTVPAPDGVQAVVTTAALLPPAVLRALEVAVPQSMSAEDVVPALDEALAGIDVAGGALDVYVEVPRDERRPALLRLLADSPYRAKFRTGGIEAHLYPDENELAEAIFACAELELAFKATAGLHHAVRNTDPETGFEQHGFLNILAATHAAAGGAGPEAIASILAERDGAALAARLEALGDDAAVRELFRSYGTCSIAEPLEELVDLGLVTRDDPTTQEGSA